MKMRKASIVIAAIAATLPAAAGEVFVPDFKVHPEDITVLMGADAKLPPGMRRGQEGTHGKFPVTGWSGPDQTIEWEVEAPAADAYAVRVLLRREGSRPLDLEVSGPAGRVTSTLPSDEGGWTRRPLDGELRLAAGRQKLALRARAAEGDGRFDAQVISIELVRPAVRDRLRAAAEAFRSDPRPLQARRYGLMFHWTFETCPRRGPRKPYAKAVEDFDVEGLAGQVARTGAGFVVLTTSHAYHYFPAPLEALDRILPGRTARRDLVADLSAALGRRGIALFLYYHLGASSDPEWLRATGFWETDTSRLFGNWTAMIEEAGRRYGERLAGWWFDDGAINYYYRSAPWERLARAAKAGHPGRMIAFNPWEYPSATEFQDYFCGEGFADPSVGGLVPAGGDGRLVGGSHRGLQACATLITEGDWVHEREDSEVGPPRWSPAELGSILKEFIARKNVPIFNLEIYQEGTVSPAAVELFEKARAELMPR